MAFFAAQCRCHSVRFEGSEEGFLRGFFGANPGKVFNLRVRYKIHFRAETVGERGQRRDLVEGVVDAGDKDVFQRDHAAVFLLIIFARGGEFAQGILFVDGHDLAAGFVGGAV